MTDKIQKIVEVKFEGNSSNLKKHAKELEGQLAASRSQTQKSAAQGAKQSRADRTKAVAAKKQVKEQLAIYKAAEKSAKLMQRMDKERLAHAKKMTAELEKQAKLAKKGGGKKGGAGGGQKSLLSKAVGALGKAAKFVGIAGLTMVGSHVRSGYQQYAQVGKARAGLQAVSTDAAGLEAAVGPGRKLGYTEEQTTQQAAAVAGRTGSVRDVNFAQKVSRAGVGLDFDAASRQMGGTRQAGFAGFQQGGGGRKEMQRMIAMGMESGLEAGRLPEFAEGISSLVAKQAAVSGGAVSNAGISALMAKFGQSGMSGFQGARGAAVASKLDQAIRKPGGGAEGESFQMRAQGFGVPGGTSSFMGARRQMQKGISDPRNLMRMVDQARSEFGGGEASTHALEKLTGLSIEQIEGTKSIVDQMKAGGKTEEEAMKELKALGETSKPIEAQVLEASKTGFLEVVQGVAKVDEHLMKIGEVVWEPLHRVQLDLLDITSSNLPLIHSAVEAIALATKETSEFITGKSDSARAVDEGSKTLSGVMSGRLSPKEGITQINEQISSIDENNSQWSSKVLGLLESAGSSVLESFGGAAIPTTAETDESAKSAMRAQQKVIMLEAKNKQTEKEIAELQKKTAEINARAARSQAEAIRNVGQAAMNPPRVETPEF